MNNAAFVFQVKSDGEKEKKRTLGTKKKTKKNPIFLLRNQREKTLGTGDWNYS